MISPYMSVMSGLKSLASGFALTLFAVKAPKQSIMEGPKSDVGEVNSSTVTDLQVSAISSHLA